MKFERIAIATIVLIAVVAVVNFAVLDDERTIQHPAIQDEQANIPNRLLASMLESDPRTADDFEELKQLFELWVLQMRLMSAR